jgi:hypothetical protein
MRCEIYLACKILVRKPLWRSSYRGRIIEIDSKEIECKGVDWIYVAKDGVLWWAFVFMVINLWVQWKAGTFFGSRLLRRTLLQGLFTYLYCAGHYSLSETYLIHATLRNWFYFRLHMIYCHSSSSTGSTTLGVFWPHWQLSSRLLYRLNSIVPYNGGCCLCFITIYVLRCEVVSLTPNPQPGGPGYLFLSGPYPYWPVWLGRPTSS